MKNAKTSTFLKSVTLMGVLLMAPLLTQAQNPDSQAVTDLLNQAREHAVLAEDDASTLASYTHSDISPQSHAIRLSQMREHANSLIDEFNQLNSLRNEGSPWQQDAIDRVNPLLREMAETLNATIIHFNDNKMRLQMPEFEQYVKSNREVMSKTAKLISDLVEYGEARAKAGALEKTLSLPFTAQKGE
jgi:hypothetical protein